MDVPMPLLLFLLLLHTVSSQQAFTVEPEDVSSFRGATVILQCRITNVQGQVQWTRNGFALGTDRELPNFPRYEFVGSEALGQFDLLIANLQLEDDALYECQIGATATSPGMRSRPANVTVKLPPDQPYIEGMYVHNNYNYVDVVAERSFNLTCVAANARPAAEVEWVNSTGDQVPSTYSFVTLQDNGKLEDTTGIFVLEPRKSNQDDSYTCRAIYSPDFAPKDTAVRLSVLYLPEVTMDVSPNRRVQEYDSMTFTCLFKANPSDVVWTWYRGDELIADVVSNELHLSQVTRDLHGKSVRCEATNSVGSSSQSYTVNVEYEPRFTSPPQHAAVDLGGDGTMACFVDGNPAPAIVWSKKDNPRILSSTGTLTIMGVTEADLGIYTCTASVIGFDEISTDVHLMQNGPPSIESDEDQFSPFGVTGYVECVMWSAPNPRTIQWVKDGVPINFREIERYSLVETDLATGWKSVIEISHVQDVDFGQFNCTAQNEYGVDSLIINFQKKSTFQLAYILIFVFVGVAVVIIFSIVIVYQCRASCCKCRCQSDTSSNGSESSLNKTRSFEAPELKLEYSRNDIYGNPIDPWRSDLDPKYSRYSADYDELRYPTDLRSPPLPFPREDYPDFGYVGDPRSDYGTYPRAGISRMEGPYGRVQPPPGSFSDPYGTYRTGMRPPYASSDYGSRPPPPISTISSRPYAASDYGGTRQPSNGTLKRLATNV